MAISLATLSRLVTAHAVRDGQQRIAPGWGVGAGQRAERVLVRGTRHADVASARPV